MVAEPAIPTPIRDRGSFRDPAGGVFHLGDRVLRYLTPRGLDDFEALERSGLLEVLLDEGALVPTRRVSLAAVPAPGEERPAAVLEHERIPFVSYPYEWPFELLQAAAIQYLQAVRTSLDHGFLLKDATPFNTQFVGTRPTMIDVTSFEPYVAGRPWAAYSQFCRMFLNPLLLQSAAGIPFQRWLRSGIEGIQPGELGAVLPLRTKLRKSVFTHVVLQAWVGRRFGSDSAAVRHAAASEVSLKTLRRLIDQLERTVRGLHRRGGKSVWGDYELDCHYEAEATAAKERFVDEVLGAWRPSVVWDLGANRGQYSAIAARHADYVVAMDGDELAAGGVTRRGDADLDRILPLVMDFGNPSPDQGWAGAERQGLTARGPADAALALALVHHLSIAGHVPLPAVVAWLADHAHRVVVEFVPIEDPMAQRLLAARLDRPDGYDQATFERALERHFRVERTIELPGSARTLYALVG
jgi:hypothetical protein